MNLQLFVIAGPDKGRFYPLTGSGITAIGTSQMHADVRLHDLGVGRVHCELEMDGERAVIADQESESGTFVNGVRITKHELKLRDVIRVGQTELVYQEEGDKPQATATKATTLPMEWVDKLVGQTLGHYAVDSVVGQGHSGLVLLAHDLKDNRVVALKVLHPAFPKNERELQPFSQAIKSVLPLRHPNLVTVYGAGKTGPYCWIAREHIEGESLTKEIERARTATTHDWKRALRVGVQLARALDHAEQHQLGHGNLTPQNILVRAGDHVTKITDLMLAKALLGSLIQQAVQPAKLRAEYLFLAPEQTHRNSIVDHRADVHALGAIIYYLMTGRPPFEGTSPNDTLAKIRQENVEKPRKFDKAIPIDLDALARRMLAKSPEERPQSFGELVTELEDVADGMGVTVS